MTDNKTTFKQWITPILISLLLLVASASFFQNKNTQNSVDMLQIQTAILSEKMSAHSDWGIIENNKNIVDIEGIEDRVAQLEIDKASYVTMEEFLKKMDEFHTYVMNNYERKK